MSVKVVYYGYLSDLAGTRENVVSVRDGASVRVRELIAEIVIKLGESSLIILVNDTPSTLEALVKAGDTVKVLPHVGGG
ncbi:MAG: MoaD/ThiS family protein [Thermofilum sp.]